MRGKINSQNRLALPGEGLIVASFFSGAGGLDLGFHEVGFEVKFANDLEKLFCETIEANKGKFYPEDIYVLHRDIRNLKRDQIPLKKIDFIIGGPPCQSFSASGRRAGGAAGRLDERGNLFKAYCNLIKQIKPKGFLFENVRGILGTNKGKDWSEIVSSFRDIGYKIAYRILDACDYGIPQHRERMFLVGYSLAEEFLFPVPTHGPDSYTNQPHISLEEALNGVNHEEDLEQLIFTEGKYSHLLPLIPPGDNYLFFTAKRGYKNPIFAYRSRFSDFLYKADPKSPSKTIIASPGKYTGPLHWENRYFSIGEYKRLQGFPDDYKFVGQRSDIIRQIGNSVSPRIAKFLALAILKQIFHKDIEIPLLSPEKRLSFDKRKGQKAKLTRKKHEIVKKSGLKKEVFHFESYKTKVEPFKCNSKEWNVEAKIRNKKIFLKVYGDDSIKPFVTLNLFVNAFGEKNLNKVKNKNDLFFIDIEVYGQSPNSIQTMWNAIDDLIIRSSNYHSLFELYGHFTEPHPIFKINNFIVHTKHPIGTFSKHVLNFKNCSKYFKKSFLIKMFGKVFKTKDFLKLVKILRSYRFDIRCQETNVAIPRDVYMVAYPFTLPYRKQMNFQLNATKSKRRTIFSDGY